MDFVVRVLCWAGWIWTAAFFALVLPLLAFKGRHNARPAAQESENQADV